MNNSARRPLPVPTSGTTGSALPVLTEVGQLDFALIELSRAVLDASAFRTFDVPSDKALATLRAAVANIDELRASWRRVDRPATVDEIRTAVLRLATTMPVAGNISLNALSEALSDDLAEVRPTKFVLARAVAKHRHNSEFLSANKLLDEIKRAIRRALHFRGILDEDFARLVEAAEESLKSEKERRRDAQKKQAEQLWQEEQKNREHEALIRRLGFEQEACRVEQSNRHLEARQWRDWAKDIR